MTETPSIVEFLTARYDENERRAETAASQASFIAVPDNDEGDPGRWCATEDGTGVTTENAYSGEPFLLMPQGYVGSEVAEYVAAVGDPARVLADIAAKRARVAMWQEALDKRARATKLTGSGSEMMRQASARLPAEADGFCEAVLKMVMLDASVYAEHPDFNPDWRVTV